MLELARVLREGTAANLGLSPGDRIVTINNEEVHDVIDYRFLVAEERVSFVVLKRDGKTRRLIINKDPDDDLGLEFPPLRIKRCRNRCIFCFVDQMPQGCRKSLYIKDDDFRVSFLHGNYITLGALSEADWDRIFTQRLSPLYVSVHAADPKLRLFILRNRNAPDIMTNLIRLAAGGIRIHAQIVLCPGINDGPQLVRTIEDLAGLFPAVISIAVVPVGLTAHRKGLYPLRTFKPSEARAVLDIVEPLGKRLKKRNGTRLVFASDEFYIKAKAEIPPVSFYEELPQIENGVGMAADFMRQAARVRIPTRMRKGTITLVTGVSFGGILAGLLERFRRPDGPKIRQIIVKNRFFGPSVTVAGLLTGSDILAALKGRRLGDMVLIPANALKEDEDVFLDNMTLDELGKKLNTPASRVADIRELAGLLRDTGRKA